MAKLKLTTSQYNPSIAFDSLARGYWRVNTWTYDRVADQQCSKCGHYCKRGYQMIDGGDFICQCCISVESGSAGIWDKVYQTLDRLPAGQSLAAVTFEDSDTDWQIDTALELVIIKDDSWYMNGLGYLVAPTERVVYISESLDTMIG